MSFHCYLDTPATTGTGTKPPVYPLVDLATIQPDAIYLRLFHGRHTPDEQLDDWGFDGPYIGPVLLGITYGTFKVHHPEHHGFEELPMVDDLIHLDGAYYGDMEVLHGRDLLPPRSRRAPPFGLPLLNWNQYEALARAAKVKHPFTGKPNPFLALAA